MPLREQLSDLLRQAFELEIALAERLTEGERNAEGRQDCWSVKDILVHVAEWKKRSRHAIELVRNGEPAPEYPDIDLTNAEIFSQFRSLAWTDALTMLAAAHQGLTELAEALDEDELSRAFAPDSLDGRPIWWRIVGTGHVHSLLHIADVLRGRGDHDEALSMMERSAESLMGLDGSPQWRGTVTYNLACMQALAGRSAEALVGLREALQLQPDLLEWSRKDPDLEPLRSHPEYLAICG